MCLFEDDLLHNDELPKGLSPLAFILLCSMLILLILLS